MQKSDQSPVPPPVEEGQDYLDHLLELADHFFRVHRERAEAEEAELDEIRKVDDRAA
jgi:hypothetical protein